MASFSSMGAGDRLTITVVLAGGATYEKEIKNAAAATTGLGSAAATASKQASTAAASITRLGSSASRSAVGMTALRTTLTNAGHSVANASRLVNNLYNSTNELSGANRSAARASETQAKFGMRQADVMRRGAIAADQVSSRVGRASSVVRNYGQE